MANGCSVFHVVFFAVALMRLLRTRREEKEAREAADELPMKVEHVDVK